MGEARPGVDDVDGGSNVLQLPHDSYMQQGCVWALDTKNILTYLRALLTLAIEGAAG